MINDILVNDMAYKVLVTGGAGYLGSVLVPALLQAGNTVTVLDSFLYDQDSLMGCCANQNFHVIRGDCRNKEVIRSAMHDQDFIIPLAAIVGFPACSNDETAATTTNYEAIETLLSLREKGQKILFPCTNSGYGIGQGEQFCTEESPLTPISLYGRTKVMAERAVLAAGDSVTFRFATLFGASARMRTDLLVNDFVYRALHDHAVVLFEGNHVRNFLHVRDAASAFLFAMKHFDLMRGNAYNCGLSDSNLTKIELCEKIKEHIPAFVYLKDEINTDPDQRNYYISNHKIEQLGFRPKHSLDDGIEELIKVFAIINKRKYGNA